MGASPGTPQLNDKSREEVGTRDSSDSPKNWKRRKKYLCQADRWLSMWRVPSCCGSVASCAPQQGATAPYLLALGPESTLCLHPYNHPAQRARLPGIFNSSPNICQSAFPASLSSRPWGSKKEQNPPNLFSWNLHSDSRGIRQITT